MRNRLFRPYVSSGQLRTWPRLKQARHPLATYITHVAVRMRPRDAAALACSRDASCVIAGGGIPSYFPARNPPMPES
jgi:hypothetical protein